MALDRLTQITSSGISSTSTITVSAVAGVVTATTLSVTGSVTTGLDVSGIVTATTVQVGSATTIHTTGIDLGGGTLTSHNINSTGIITATGGFVGAVTGNVTGNLSGNVSGTAVTATTASFTNATISGDLTVQGTTTTLDTTLTEVDKLEVGANNTTVGVAITQSGTGDILRLYDSGTQVVTVTDGGSVGIGTENPAQSLHVFGSTGTNIQVQQTSGSIYLGSSGSTRFGLSSGANVIQSTGADFAIGSQSGNNLVLGTNNSERLRIDSSGNLRAYQSGTNGNTRTLNFEVYGGTALEGNGVIEFKRSRSSVADTQTAVVNNVLGQIKFSGSDGTSFGEGARIEAKSFSTWSGSDRATELIFHVTPDSSTTLTEAMRIRYDGNVGIGTDNPTQKLTVFDVISVKGAPGGSSQVLFSDTDSDYSGRLFYNHTTNALQFVVNSEERLRITSTGNVGIGTDNPEAKCVVYSTGAEVVPFRVKSGDTDTNGSFIGFENIGNSPNGYNTRCGVIDSTSFSIFTSNNERLRIDSGGKIGIGITNPSGKLTVYDNSQNFNDGQNLIRLEYPGGYSQGDTGGGIVFSQHWFSGDTARVRTGGIYGVKTGQSGIYGGGLAIYTQPHGGDPMQELVRLSGRQRIGIGHTDPLSKVEIQGSGDGGSGVTGLSDLTTKSSLLIKGLSGSNTSLMAGVRVTGGQFIQGAYRAETTVSVRDISINPYGGSVSLGGVASNFGGAPDGGGTDVKIYTTPNTSGAGPAVRAYVQSNGGISYYTGSTGYNHNTYGSYNGFGMARWTEGYSNTVAYSQYSTGGTFWHESITRGISTFSNVGLISFQGSGNCGFVVTVEYWMVSAVNANRQYGKLSAHAWRTGNNNFNISTENDISRDYFGNGGTSAYINLSWGSSGSGSSQVLTLRVSSDAVYSAGSYTRTLFRTTYSAMDYANVVTVLR